MRFGLLLLFIAVPLLEIALLIKAGESFGFWPTFALIVFTAILGTVMLRWQGLTVLSRAGDAIRAGRMPIESVADGAFLLVAGALLLTPGIMTDCFGLALMVPAVRRWIGTRLLRTLTQKAGLDSDRDHPQEQHSGSARATGSRAGTRKPHDKPPVIDADYEEIDPK